MERQFGFRPGNRRERVRIHTLCEAWLAARGERAGWPGPYLPVPTALHQLAHRVSAHPALEAALDAVEWVDIDSFAKQVAHVASLPVGEVADALRAVDRLEPDFRAGSVTMAPSEALARACGSSTGASP